MTVIARYIRATPHRTADETWTFIANLICRDDANANAEFHKVNGVGLFLVADEILKNFPLVIIGSGPRLRVYCIYDEAAIVDGDANEDDLSWSPTPGSWKCHIPCPKDEKAWIEKLISKAPIHFTVYDPDDGIDNESAADSNKFSVEIDDSSFGEI